MAIQPLGLSTSLAEAQSLSQEVGGLRQRVAQVRKEVADGRAPLLPGNAAFLSGDYVVCFERDFGDSRYLYGERGFAFWVHATGVMYGNDGPYFLFAPHNERAEPQVGFFLGTLGADGTSRAISLLPTPYVASGEVDVRTRYAVFGHEAAYFITETEHDTAALRVYVAQSHGERIDVVFSVLITTAAEEARPQFVAGYLNPFCRHQFGETGEDRWFKRVEIGGRDSAPPPPPVLPPFVISVNEDLDRFRSLTNRSLVRRSTSCQYLEPQVCTSRHAFLGGARLSLGQARCLRTGRLPHVPLTVFNDTAVVSDLNRFSLQPRGEARFDYVFSTRLDDAAFQEELRTPVQSCALDRDLVRIRLERQERNERLVLRVEGDGPARVTDATFNHFVPFLVSQVRACAQTNGYLQPSPNSLIGIRDVFQALEGQTYEDAAAVREKMREALAYVLFDGRSPRQYSPPINGQPGPADLREFIDSGAWVIAALHTYVCVTGDVQFLDEIVGYHELGTNGAALRRSDEVGPVVEHALRIMQYFNDQRDRETGLVRALYGDWNDAVDGLGVAAAPGDRFGSGVSVMASLQYRMACQQMTELLEHAYPARYLNVVRDYRQRATDLGDALLRHAVAQRRDERRIVHGWGDQRSYYVGSFQDSDGAARDSLTSNAFWVLAGMLDAAPALRGHILAAFDRLDSPFGLKTFEPGFAPDAPGVGRIGKLPIGTAENAATYVHATLFAVMALFEMGEPRRAWQQIGRILPFAPHQARLSHSPFVMPNSYVQNPELNLTGQSMNDWQTGASNVLLKTLVRHAVGFRPGLDALWLRPAAWSPFESINFAGTVHGRRVAVTVTHGGRRAQATHNGADLTPDSVDGGDAPRYRLEYDQLSRRDETHIAIGIATGPGSP